MSKKDQFLTTAEFASKAGIPTTSVTKLIKEGKINVYRGRIRRHDILN